MSWIEQYSRGIKITTGDSKEYLPDWMNASVQTSYQTSQFEFINVSGSLVLKSQPIGVKYNLEIYFQGDDHLDTAAAFRRSTTDRRPWTVEHPLYGILLVQVSSLDYDNSTSKSFTKITGTMIETINDGNANIFVLPLDQIPIVFDEAINNYSESLTEPVAAGDIPQLNSDNVKAYSRGVPVIPSAFPEEFEAFYNAFNTATTYINTATETPLLMINSVMRVLTLPASFSISVKDRVNLLYSALQSLRENILGFFTPAQKQLFQCKSGATLAAICLAGGTPLPSDYKNASSILDVIDIITAARDQFISDLDSLQTDNGGSEQSYVPDADALITTNNLVNTTIAALFNLSLSARSERNHIVEKDTSWIVLAHRFYGLNADDSNLIDLMDSNSVGLPTMLTVPKGQKIVYYI